MKTIWKFPLPATGEAAIDMPAGSRLLAVQTQGGDGFIWALVDPDATTVRRVVEVRGTGWTLPDAPGEYVGTFQTGPFVWHVFDRGEAV